MIIIIIGEDFTLIQDDFRWLGFPYTYGSRYANVSFNNFCNEQGLTDAWRHPN